MAFLLGLLLRGAMRVLSCLPLAWVHAVGGVLGVLVYALSPRYRHHLCANLQQAQLPARLRLAVAANSGRQMLELSHIWCYPLEKVLPLIREIRHIEILHAAQQAGHGIVFMTPHLGCFEITAQYYAAGHDITVLYREPKQAPLREMILRGRQREHLHLAPADLAGVRRLIKALKRGEAVGLLPDQAPKAGEGAWIPFFSRWAYTMTLAARLSMTGALVVYAWAERLPSGEGFRLHFSAPQIPLSGDVLQRAEQINHDLERLILQCPEQYLWGYNRYKQPGEVPPPTEPPVSAENAQA